MHILKRDFIYREVNIMTPRLLRKTIIAALVPVVFILSIHVEYIGIDMSLGDIFYGTPPIMRLITVLCITGIILLSKFKSRASYGCLFLLLSLFALQLQQIRTVSSALQPSASVTVLSVVELNSVALCREGSADDLFFKDGMNIRSAIDHLDTKNTDCTRERRLRYIYIPFLVNFIEIDRKAFHRTLSGFIDSLID